MENIIQPQVLPGKRHNQEVKKYLHKASGIDKAHLTTLAVGWATVPSAAAPADPQHAKIIFPMGPQRQRRWGPGIHQSQIPLTQMPFPSILAAHPHKETSSCSKP